MLLGRQAQLHHLCTCTWVCIQIFACTQLRDAYFTLDESWRLLQPHTSLNTLNTSHIRVATYMGQQTCMHLHRNVPHQHCSTAHLLCSIRLTEPHPAVQVHVLVALHQYRCQSRHWWVCCTGCTRCTVLSRRALSKQKVPTLHLSSCHVCECGYAGDMLNLQQGLM